MLKVYGMELSVPSNKVRFTANALGLEYEYKSMNLMEGEQKADWFVKINPVGRVPAIDDDGFSLFESNAIIKYLADKNNSAYYPKDLKAMAKVEQWIDFTSLHIAAAMTRVLFNRILAPVIGAEVDENSLKTGIEFLAQFLPIVDQQLGKSKYLAGDNMSLADIVLLASVDPAEACQIDLTPYTNLVKWRQDLQAKDFYTKCHKSYADVLAAMSAK